MAIHDRSPPSSGADHGSRLEPGWGSPDSFLVGDATGEFDGRMQVRALLCGVLVALVTTTLMPASQVAVTEAKPARTAEGASGAPRGRDPLEQALTFHRHMGRVVEREAEKASRSATRTLPTEEQWAALRWCESNDIPDIVSSNGLWHGLYQFDVSTWASVGGTGLPSEASREEQDMRAQMLYDSRGSQPWPLCGRYLP